MTTRPIPTRLCALATAAAAATCVLLTAAAPAQAALVARDLTGDSVPDAYYDTVLNISWYAVTTNAFANANDARNWAASLVVGAAADWRLPNELPLNGTTYDYLVSNDGSTDRGTAATGTGWGTASEMGHLFYVTLANIGCFVVDPANPNSLVVNPAWNPAAHDDGPLDWVAGDVQYFGEQVAVPGGYPFVFSFHYGLRYVLNDGPSNGYAMAVHPGDVGALVGGGGGELPEPSSLLLAAGALLGAGARRRWLRSQG